MTDDATDTPTSPESTADRLDRRGFLLAAAAVAGAAAGSGTASASSHESIVEGLSRSEKIALTHGHEGSWTGYILGNSSAGIPEIAMLDGPLGVRTDPGGPRTAFPAATALASTFDPELLTRVGEAMGREAKASDAQCLLGPSLNIHRVPTCGRNFEYYSEDPYLTARLAAACCRGIQAEGVVATPKHYVANHQETRREDVIAEIDERTLRELYLPGFKAAVQEGGAGAVMSAYNGVNGYNCSENEFLLTDVLKDEWGFSGYVVSDWDAIQDPVAAANAGLDLDMPGETTWGEDYFDAALEPAVRSGEVPESRLDDMVTRILHAYEETGHLDGDLDAGEANTTAHQMLAREVARDGAVLLKNEGDVLPIDVDAIDSIGLVGPTASQAVVGGGGAAEVEPPYAVSARDGLEEAVGGDVEILEAGADGGVESVAAAADVVLAFGHVDSSEFEDRQDMHLDGNQDDLIERAAAANPNTVAVLQIPAPIELPWLDDVAGVLTVWYPGMEGGNAIASLVTGLETPAGKLPTTFGRAGDYPAAVENATQISYDEGIFVGYRHFDEADLEPLFPFGFGLSYTTFEYAAVDAPARIDPDEGATVTVDVENVGDHAGAEIVQVYVSQVDPAVPRPPKELKGFDKVWLGPGETVTAEIALDREAFHYWHPDEEAWVLEEGEFEIQVAASSRDVRETVPVEVTTDAGGDGGIDLGEYEARPYEDSDRYWDVDGSGTLGSNDVVAFFEHVEDAAVQDNPAAFDFNGSGGVGFDDVVALFLEV